MDWAGRVAGRALLVGLGIGVPLGLVEMGLRLVANVYRRAPAVDALGIDEGAFRILCVGDSNTFGVWVGADETWPARLQALLNANAKDGARFQVVNEGIPGQNGALMFARLEHELERTRPSLVLVLAGVNDGWNSIGRDGAEPALASWCDELRVVKLVRIAFHVVRERRALLEVESGSRSPARFDADEVRAMVHDDVVRISLLAREHGAAVVLQTYPGQRPWMAAPNQAIRAAAQDLGAPLVDHDLSFRSAIAASDAENLLFDDGHPNAHGYASMAEFLARFLAEQGLVPARPPR